VLNTKHCTDDDNGPTVLNSEHVASDMFRDWANGVIGTAPSVGNPAAYERADGVSSVIYRGPSNDVKELALVESTWGLWNLSSFSHAISRPTGNLSAHVRADGISAIVYRESGKHVMELALTANGWLESDLTQISTNPFPTTDLDPMT